jgi:hypothetical protein
MSCELNCHALCALRNALDALNPRNPFDPLTAFPYKGASCPLKEPKGEVLSLDANLTKMGT